MPIIEDSSKVPVSVSITFSSSDPNVITVQQDPNDQTKAVITATGIGKAILSVDYKVNVD